MCPIETDDTKNSKDNTQVDKTTEDKIHSNTIRFPILRRCWNIRTNEHKDAPFYGSRQVSPQIFLSDLDRTYINRVVLEQAECEFDWLSTQHSKTVDLDQKLIGISILSVLFPDCLM